MSPLLFAESGTPRFGPLSEKELKVLPFYPGALRELFLSADYLGGIATNTA